LIEAERERESIAYNYTHFLFSSDRKERKNEPKK
jgi:hypothetical protein